jgi:hypothetical protein
MLEVGSNYIQLNFTDNQMSNRNAIDIINSFGITINTGSLKEDIHKEQRKTNTLQKILHVFGPKATS